MRFILTFGSDHKHPDTGGSLFGRFCILEDVDEDAARLQAGRIFGYGKWGANFSHVLPYSETRAKRPGVFPTPRERATSRAFTGDGVDDGANLYTREYAEWFSADTVNTHVHVCSEHEYSVTHTEDECRPTVTCPEGCVI
jgi:hypothetical protein